MNKFAAVSLTVLFISLLVLRIAYGAESSPEASSKKAEVEFTKLAQEINEKIDKLAPLARRFKHSSGFDGILEKRQLLPDIQEGLRAIRYGIEELSGMLREIKENLGDYVNQYLDVLERAMPWLRSYDLLIEFSSLLMFQR